MLAPVRALFEQIIDYAGLFPPAKLPLPEALQNYAHYRHGRERWLLARFVCPASQLADLTEVSSDFRVAVLGQGGANADEFARNLRADLAAIEKLHERRERGDIAEMMEMPLPAQLEPEAMTALLKVALDRLQNTGLRVFFEIPLDTHWSGGVRASCAVLAGRGGLKIRCGGLTAAAFPTEAVLAEFMICCRDAGVPWKATAGLHHPLPRWDAALAVRMHGFLNVFGAGVLSRLHPLSAADLIEILHDEEGKHFWFQGERFGWKTWACSTTDIADIRRRWLPSFGSCSVEEPFADLVQMRLIEA